MSYTVLARKYRPQSFAELVGQEHVARIIGNAIAQGRVAHAFLFTGVRGVGKTTTARILAKSLNCEKGPTAEPCNACGPCLDITAGRDVDVQEIDGASNNSVDDVRRLQESLPFRPARDRFKIVIVDEVHMLSTGAFNAFLKTLEEPPSHVKFIFATTEIHKVPVTIRSRCQRYDFRLIPRAVVAGRVKDILAREGITADEGTVALVAREAAGSMRDALTLLDQVVAFGGTTLAVDEVARVLGVAGREQVRSLAAALVVGDARAVLAALRGASELGTDPLHFARQVLEVLRDLAVAGVTGDVNELEDWVAEERAFASELLRKVEPVELQRLFSMATRVVDEVARSSTPALALEMGWIRVATRPRLGAIEDLIARLEAAEARGGGRVEPGAGSGGAAPRGGGRGPEGGRGGVGASGPFASPESAMHADAGPREETHRESTDAGRYGEPPVPNVFEGPRSSAPDDARPAWNEAPRSAYVADGGASATLRGGDGGQAFRAPAGVPPAAPAPESLRAPASLPASRPSDAPVAARGPDSVPAGAPASGRSLRRAAILEWEAVVARLRHAQPPLAAIVEQGEARVVSAERIVLVFLEGSFFGRQASLPESIAALRAAATEAFGVTPTVEVKLDGDVGQRARTLADVTRDRTRAEQEGRRREVMQHPVVVDALDVFPEARGKETIRFDGES